MTYDYRRAATTGKKSRYPEGTFTEEEWVEQHADRVEPYKKSVESLIDRNKLNRMDRGGQDEYLAKMKQQAAKQRYRAWKGDTYYEVSKKTYENSTKGARKPKRTKWYLGWRESQVEGWSGEAFLTPNDTSQTRTLEREGRYDLVTGPYRSEAEAEKALDNTSFRPPTSL